MQKNLHLTKKNYSDLKKKYYAKNAKYLHFDRKITDLKTNARKNTFDTYIYCSSFFTVV